MSTLGTDNSARQNTERLEAEILRLSTRLAAAEEQLRQRPFERSALLSSRRQYQRLLDTIDEGFCIIRMKFDDAGRACDYQFIETNRAFETHTGLVGAEGRWIREMVPEHEQHWFDVYGEVARTGKSLRFEDRAEAMNRWYEVHCTAVDEEAGLVAVLFNDISAQRNAELALRESEEYWRGLFEKLDDGFILGELIRDPDGVARDWRYLDVNPAWGLKVGIDPGQVKGKSVRQLFPGIEEFWIAEPAQAVANQKAAAFNHQVGNLGRWYEGRVHPLDQERFVIIFRDVTEAYGASKRRQALLEFGDTLRDLQVPEEVAAAATRLIGQTLGVSGACYVAVEQSGSTQVVGQFQLRSADAVDYPALLAGLPLGHALAISDVRDDPRTAAWTASGVQALLSVALVESGVPVAALCVLQAQAHVWTEAESRFVRDVAERTRAAIARRRAESDLRALNVALERTVQERTEELLRSEEQLRQSQKMEAVGQLTGGIAHDFNNLLTGISGSLEMMQSRIRQGRFGELDRYISAAHGASRRAAALTHRLLAFSRRQTLDPKPTDLNQLVAGMQELIVRTMGPGVHTEMITDNQVWPANVDANQLENALLNLCINARDAMPDGGRLTVETANRALDERAAAAFDLPPGNYVSLCVSDTGTGMSPEVAERAFEPFYTTKPIGMGTGLGLSMIYGFIRQSGGQAKIYSEVGMGSTICLHLPRYLGEQVQDEPMRLAEMPRAVDGETVLVVDDEPTVRLLVREILEELGYHAIEAADGPSGLQILESDVRIDLLVSDVGLPGNMNGRQMADLARVRRPDLKVLFITGYAEKAVLGNGDLAPNMHIMTKPFSIEGLAVRIKNLIETDG
ncbi:response regulator [Pseudomonas sp. HR96]|uniref:ATP-binding protein n=1 Tax=Pseudomonas sp. HR96 TaxID=1027966 RepID=UPI002A7607B2|nr:ATP-binding protein [Pseudomonas sp. HR96]WPO98229.1 response regulator [Pseudomonas sp. HR96]